MVGTRSTVRREREQQNMASKSEATQVTKQDVKYSPPASQTSKITKKSSTSSAKARRAQLLLEAAKEKAQIQLELIDKKLAVDLAELESSRSENEPSEFHHRNVEEWLETSQQELMKAAGPIPSAAEPVLRPERMTAAPALDGTDDTMHMLASALKDLAAAATTGTNGTNANMYNRLCMPKELPVFNGDPLEWLHYKQAYEESSAVCNFSDRENLWRIRKSLQGRAKEAVMALLIGATSPVVVMTTLQLQFGNSDVIISRILQDINKLRPISQDYQREIVPFSVKVKNCVAAVTAMGCEDYLKGMALMSTVLSKLPTVLISKWTDYSYPLLEQNTKPSLVVLSEFLSLEALKITQCSVNLFTSQQHNCGHNKSKSQTVLVNTEENENKNNSDKCGFCHQSKHTLPECTKFKKALRKNRWTYVKRRNICFKCLMARHRNDTCTSAACESCGKNHHRLLHYNIKETTEGEQPVSGSSQPTSSTVIETSDTTVAETITNINLDNRKVLLKTVPVLINGPNGTSRSVALLDDGSTVTLISESLVARLGLRGYKQSMRVCGAWDNSELILCDSEIIDLNISNFEGKIFNIKARSVNNMNLPVQNKTFVDLSDYRLKPEIKSAISDGQSKPEILIGQDNYHLILPLEIIKGKPNEPYLTRTPLGWCVHGCVRAPSLTGAASSLHLQSTFFMYDENLESERILRNIHDEIRQSYAIENIGVSVKPRQNVEDLQALECLERTAELKDGRWYVGLPWKDSLSKMPDSYTNALARLRGVEKKMSSTGYASRYRERIEHLLSNDYASQIEDTDGPNKIWYLPHFGVDNPNKQKLRLVFDAAANSNGVCLNDYLLKGPDLLISLYGTMLRFRENKIGITGDIRDMFLRIKIRNEDRDALRFLWRESPEEPVKTYAMSSLIFGANCSPFIAQFIKNKNAERYKTSMPAAVQAIHKQHYMDDYIDSFQNEETAARVVNEINHIHKQGGFEMRNWTCNNHAVLNTIPTEYLRSTAVTFKVGQQYDGERTLGLIWNPKDDTLGFDVSFKKIPNNIITGQKKPSKREMLRVVMSIFDVFGFLSPFTIKGKIMLQDAWRSAISWDEEITDDLYIKWTHWLSELKNISNVRLPRHYLSATRSPATTATRATPATNGDLHALAGSTTSVSETHGAVNDSYQYLQLHVFCDASVKAMCAVAYWRWFDRNKQIRVAFVSSKCRVAPVKYVSVPRLELQAALIGARLADTIKQEHKMEITQKFMWSDSATVLHWIYNDRRTYKAYVAHRLGEIDEYTQIKEWKYVPTKINIADVATRECCDVKALENEWLYGPAFLYEDENLWPQQFNVQLPDVSDVDLECVNTLHITPICLPAVPEPEKFASWRRLLRATCVVMSFVEKKCKKRAGTIDGAMMERAEKLLIKYSQIQSFPEDLENLKQNKTLLRKSKLLTLSPIIDDDGVLRVGGRIDAASEIKQEVKQPIILDGRNYITHLIVRQYHERAYHGNQELVVNELKQKYWIIRLRPTVKHIASKCMFCRIKRAQPQPPRMGDLPKARLAHHQRPFTFTGVDLFGPMYVAVARRREKRYGVLFTCLTVRAIHIEIVSSLTTDDVIMALRRMAARRGWPAYLYSDNGTNLRGADKELKKCVSEIDEDQLARDALTYGSTTTWTFSPPASPHWGGAWERLIRCVKNALKVVLKERAPREAVLTTLMAEVELMVNSRPLTHVSVEPNSEETLTPNHFLLGSSSNLPVLGNFDETDIYLRKQWRMSQRLSDLFWKRWVKEVLPDMRPRKKWQQEQRPIQVGDLVLIVDPASPRNVWPRGKVERVMPGRDGRIRVVEVRTSSGLLQRSVTRIARLPVGNEC